MCFCDVPDADMIHEWLLFTPLACQDESSTLSNNLFLSFIQTKWDSDFQQELSELATVFFIIVVAE